ncbi:exodeoxyribonuclease VII small subunit [Zavarzinia sp. CC-PAN008]|uniref:exodeoxyribonuclease VII small subunit n=1 Tax=Zavarzinia sp. CC-PAN008 TaxID=3243332 RepID=UPI003F747278
MSSVADSLPADIAAMSFEQALKALEDIVRRLEEGKVELEESIEIYGRGVHLKRHCEAKLETARTRVERIVLGTDGTVEARAADVV